MSQSSEKNLALFIDFDNVALGARDARMRFDVRMLMQRVLEKGKVVVKRAYADWHYYKEHMVHLHEAAIELIEVPMPKISGKNSADIRMVVDAIDLCYSKDHIDTFVVVSGDSDFSPLVSKLRENNKRVIGIGVKNSSSHLLISNCDEFIFYDDIYQSQVSKLSEKVGSVPKDKRQLFDFLLNTTQSLLQESRGVLYSSLIKDTMKRKQPDFNETNYGYSTFGDLLEDARDHGLLAVERDSRAGGTLVVLGLGKGEAAAAARGGSKTRRGGRRRGGGGRNGAESPVTQTPVVQEEVAVEEPAAEAAPDQAKPARRSRRRGGRRKKAAAAEAPAAETPADAAASPEPPPPPPPPAESGPEEAPAKKTAKKAAKKKTAKKTTAKKTAKKTAAKKTAKKKTAKKAAKKTATKKE